MNDDDPAGDYWMAVQSSMGLRLADKMIQEASSNKWTREAKNVLGEVFTRIRLLRDIVQKHESDCRDKYEESVKAVPS